MLDEHGAEYEYREYTKEPLSADELRTLFKKLKMHPGEMLRTREKIGKELGLSKDDAPDRLIEAMAAHPTLLQRPIGVRGSKAVNGRPVENLLELL